MWARVLFFKFNFWPHCAACPWPGIKPGQRQWKHRILTTRPPGNSLSKVLKCLPTLLSPPRPVHLRYCSPKDRANQEQEQSAHPLGATRYHQNKRQTSLSPDTFLEEAESITHCPNTLLSVQNPRLISQRGLSLAPRVMASGAQLTWCAEPAKETGARWPLSQAEVHITGASGSPQIKWKHRGAGSLLSPLGSRSWPTQVLLFPPRLHLSPELTTSSLVTPLWPTKAGWEPLLDPANYRQLEILGDEARMTFQWKALSGNRKMVRHL